MGVSRAGRPAGLFVNAVSARRFGEVRWKTRTSQVRIATVATRLRWSLPNPGLVAIWVTVRRAPVST